VEVASNGLEALDCIRRGQPALIILDLLMPVMDGWELVGELQQHQDWRKTPIVVVSGKDLTPQDREQLQNQVKSILQKGSLSCGELTRQLQEAVQRFLPKPRSGQA